MPDKSPEKRAVGTGPRFTPQLLDEITESIAAELSERGLSAEAEPSGDGTGSNIIVRDGVGDRIVLQMRSERPGSRIDEMGERLANIRKRNEHTGRELERLRRKIAAA